MNISSTELRKRKPRLDSKFKKRYNKTDFSIHDSIFIFLSYGTWIVHIGSGWLLSNNFCKACQHCLHPSFVIVHKAAVRMNAPIVALL